MHRAFLSLVVLVAAFGWSGTVVSANLITNIGYGAGATHTRKRDAFADLPTEAMEFPLRHPPTVEHHREADRAFFDLALKAA